MVRTRQPRIERAISVVERELDIVTTERDAFRRFLARLDDVEVDRSAPDGVRGASPAVETRARAGGGVTVAARERRADGAMRAIRAAYRETVMDVPHYGTEYDDTLFENLAAEVGVDLAAYVTEEDALTGVVYDSLVEAIERCIDERANLRPPFRRELESLREAETELNEAEADAIELGAHVEDARSSRRAAAIDDRLADVERRCVDLVDRRQRRIHNRSFSQLSGVAGVSLTRFLYGDLETTCPVLADAVDCIETIRHYRERSLR
jgi:hypothetical protein